MPLRLAVVSIALIALSWAAPAMADKRVALVVGNSAYIHSPQLPNPVNDASAIAKALTEAGFEVTVGLDLSKAAFDAKVREFAQSLEGADVGLLFYAGHGLQVAGRNYLVPIDAALKKERDLDFEGITLDFVLKQMELGREDKTNVVFLDACRDNPLSRNLARTMGTRSASVGQGLAEVQTGVGTFVSYSTQPGNVALDGDGANSPFTTALVKGVRATGQNLNSVMAGVRKDVLAATQGKQVPWDHSSLTGDFYFHPLAPSGEAGSASSSADMQERLRQLELQLKQADPAHTAKVVELAQAREQMRAAKEANKEDQNQIFEVQRSRKSGDNTSMEIGKIQIRMVRRSQTNEKLQERISQLEKELGLPVSAVDAR